MSDFEEAVVKALWETESVWVSNSKITIDEVLFWLRDTHGGAVHPHPMKVAAADELERYRALSCLTCVHGSPIEDLVRCDRYRIVYLADHFCARWSSK